jgi:hypothetical protein
MMVDDGCCKLGKELVCLDLTGVMSASNRGNVTVIPPVEIEIVIRISDDDDDDDETRRTKGRRRDNGGGKT